MATIIEFPADAASRRLGVAMQGAADKRTATILILPAVRIERQSSGSSDDRGPEQGKTPGRRRRRR